MFYLKAASRLVNTNIFFIPVLLFVSCQDSSTKLPEPFGFGRIATANEIRTIDFDIRPDGTGLPQGTANTHRGSIIYAEKCMVCHGLNGKTGIASRLIGVADTIKEKTIGNYWPYTTTVYDYIKRTMPFNAPGSLSDEEVYDLTAWLLFKNEIIDSLAVVNEKTLPHIEMPAKKFFVTDDRKGGKEIK